jgi:DNA-3-methyladenine glycosylase I
MADPVTYCDAVANLPPDDVNRRYHDFVYGFPVTDENELFGRLILEINQAGLSWTTILKKESNFRAAYAGFDVDAVAAFGGSDRERLLEDAGIVRNRLKVDAAIANANRVVELRDEYGSFGGWLDAHHPRALDEWVKLFRSVFRFTGGEITKEFLLSTGYLPGAHAESCPVYAETIRAGPAWMRDPTRM